MTVWNTELQVRKLSLYVSMETIIQSLMLSDQHWESAGLILNVISLFSCVPAVWLAAVCAAGRTRPCHWRPERGTGVSGRTAGLQPSSWCSPAFPSGSLGRYAPPSPVATRPNQSQRSTRHRYSKLIKGLFLPFTYKHHIYQTCWYPTDHMTNHIKE